jgi:hypothetical protein
MSKERARRREARLAESARRRRTAERRASRGRLLRSLRGRVPRRRRIARLSSGRSRAQLAGVAVGLTLVLLLTWYFTDSWPVRIAVVVLSLIALPAIVTLTLDRSTR